MKEWIRRHPWRLEVVPIALFAYAIITPLLVPLDTLRTSVFYGPWHWHKLPKEEAWLTWYLLTTLMSLNLLIWQTSTNHAYLFGRESRNWVLRSFAHFLFWTCFIMGGLMGPYLFGYIIMVVIGATIQLHLLKNQPMAIKQDNEPEEIAPVAQAVEPGETFYYRELFVPGMWEYSSIVLGATMLAIWLWHFAGILWIAVAVGPLMFIIRLTFGLYSTFSVSNEQVVVKRGKRRTVIPIGKIKCCSIQQFDLRQGSEEIEVDSVHHLLRGYSNRYLVLETLDGKTKLFRINKPVTACKLIQTALAARE